MKEKLELVRGSGNVFRDFGDANADLEQARAILAAKIIGVLDRQKLSTREAQKVTGVAASEFSRIRNVKLDRFTIDRMVTILGKLGQDVQLTVRVQPRRKRSANEARQVALVVSPAACPAFFAAMIWSAVRPVSSAMWSNFDVNVPTPAVAERISMIRSPLSVSGIIAFTESQPAQPSRVSKPRIWPRRPDRIALIFAVASFGHTISTRWIGSSSTGCACGSASTIP